MTTWVKKIPLVDRDKWHKLKVMAAERDRKIYELLDEALEQYLAG